MRLASWILISTLVGGLGLGCGGDDGGSTTDAAPPAIDAAGPDGPPPTRFGGDRPADLLVPSSYDPATPIPLVIALHGYSNNNTYVTGVTRLAFTYETDGFLLIAPSGSPDQSGNYFWNATDACCNFYGSQVDDVAYLNGLIDEISAAYNVDPRRIYLVGHSNGAFMSYRMACTSASRIAAIVSFAGATFDDAADCAPAARVSVLQIHGTADTTIQYAGGSNMVQGAAVPYPGAVGSAARWATYDGCAATRSSSGPALDLTGDATAETTPTKHDGCPAGVDVELWTVADAPHLIILKPGADPLWTWLSAHPRPMP